MTESCVMQGRRIEPVEFLQVRELVANHPEWSRYRLSRELCVLWDWRTPTKQWKDMAARTLMLKLAERGWIRLPERRALSPNRHRLAPPPPRSWPTTPITGRLSELGPLAITEVSAQVQGRGDVRAALAQYHYLGYRTPVGETCSMWSGTEPIACWPFWCLGPQRGSAPRATSGLGGTLTSARPV